MKKIVIVVIILLCCLFYVWVYKSNITSVDLLFSPEKRNIVHILRKNSPFSYKHNKDEVYSLVQTTQTLTFASKPRLKKLPKEVCLFKNLKGLYLGYTAIDELPDCIKDMEHLESIQISSLT